MEAKGEEYVCDYMCAFVYACVCEQMHVAEHTSATPCKMPIGIKEAINTHLCLW